ncbi:hypothetical protein D9758_016848 [Tetrapyrgos nigripes]|uniref:Uncharacterized protein n=1 Tax=Tetrapyrgos nigripes TaxID=182062 RepID=A0A8H5CF74_9AGAR|nr:hypothetical protein D9758_016848 [Tetrapyrgos nigripes]
MSIMKLVGATSTSSHGGGWQGHRSTKSTSTSASIAFSAIGNQPEHTQMHTRTRTRTQSILGLKAKPQPIIVPTATARPVVRIELVESTSSWPDYRPLDDVPSIAGTLTFPSSSSSLTPLPPNEHVHTPIPIPTTPTPTPAPEYVLGWELPSREAYHNKYIRSMYPGPGLQGMKDIHGWHEEVTLKKWRVRYGREGFSDCVPCRTRTSDGRFILVIGSNASRNEINVIMREETIAASKDVFETEGQGEPRWIRHV